MKNLYNKLTFIAIFAGIFFFINVGLAETTCEQKYHGYGKCAGDCAILGSDYHKDTADGLCANTGEFCCHKTAAGIDEPSPLESIALQIPIFEVATVNDLPTYIGNLYRYLVIILVPLAIVMIIVGGVSWILAAGDQGKITNAKKYITASFSGLIIGLFSYILLSLVGIETLNMPGLEKIKRIEGIPLSIYNEIMKNAGLTPSDTSPEACKALGEQIAKEMNIPPCYFVTIVTKESGCKANAVGHDENAPGSPANRAFKNLGGKVPNSDKMCATPPEYCLDWRFSHGFGAGQYTFSGKIATKLEPWCSPDGQPSRSQSWVQNGKCLTVAEILDVRTSLEIAGDYYNHYIKSGIRTVFLRYNGAEAYANDAMKIYQKCCQERGGC